MAGPQRCCRFTQSVVAWSVRRERGGMAGPQRAWSHGRSAECMAAWPVHRTFGGVAGPQSVWWRGRSIRRVCGGVAGPQMVWWQVQLRLSSTILLSSTSRTFPVAHRCHGHAVMWLSLVTDVRICCNAALFLSWAWSVPVSHSHLLPDGLGLKDQLSFTKFTSVNVHALISFVQCYLNANKLCLHQNPVVSPSKATGNPSDGCSSLRGYLGDSKEEEKREKKIQHYQVADLELVLCVPG